MDKVIKTLNAVRGILDVKVLSKEDKQKIFELEKEENVGIFECLKRKSAVIIVHDSEFRDPVGDLVVVKEGKVVFPVLEFPELGYMNSVSSSPSQEVHDFLVKRYSLKRDKECATIVIGFDEELPGSSHRS